MKYLKLIRVQNLLFILLIQYLIRQFVVVPLLLTQGIDLSGQKLYLILLMGATVFIAAGAYVLNDYFDSKIDAINKPDRQFVGKSISRRMAMLLHQILTFIGVLLGVLLSYFLKSYSLLLIFIVIPGLLWFYSASYKRQFMVGNIVVALIAGLTVLLVGMVEVAVLRQQYYSSVVNTGIAGQIYAWTGGFALFSFMLTWIREVIKDMEDLEGDREMECRTMPIIWGINKTKFFVIGLIVVSVTLLFVVYYYWIPYRDTLGLRYMVFGLLLPLMVLSYTLIRARVAADFRSASGITKFIMLLGLGYAPVLYYQLVMLYQIPWLF